MTPLDLVGLTPLLDRTRAGLTLPSGLLMGLLP